MQQEKTYTVKEYANLVGVQRTTVYRQIKLGKLDSIQEGGKLRVLVKEEPDFQEVQQEFANTVALLTEQIREKDEQIKALLERVSVLDETIRQQNDAIQQQNVIVMQMTRNTESAQRLLEYHEKGFFRRIFGRSKNDKDAE